MLAEDLSIKPRAGALPLHQLGPCLLRALLREHHTLEGAPSYRGHRTGTVAAV